jgi:hypothetical protein
MAVPKTVEALLAPRDHPRKRPLERKKKTIGDVIKSGDK